jgi:hypothetical protein
VEFRAVGEGLLVVFGSGESRGIQRADSFKLGRRFGTFIADAFIAGLAIGIAAIHARTLPRIEAT